MDQMQSQLQTKPATSNFWDADTKKTAIKYAFAFGLILVFGLLGANVLDNSDLVKGVIGK
jgi:hypothetical protein